MKASVIYINQLGVPCALTRDIPESLISDGPYGFHIQWGSVAFMNDVKQSTVPIREEDQKLFPSNFNEGRCDSDTFYPVEPYEFELDRIKVFDHREFNNEGVKRVARIIRPSEPKADPKEKELKDEIMEILLASHVKYDIYHEFSGHWEKAKDFDYDMACQKLTDHFKL